jgi:putative SOS response-associated peptidase YedK
MCGRFLAMRPDPLTIAGRELAALAASGEGLKVSGEVFPTDLAPVLVPGLKARAMTWGFPGHPQKGGAKPRPLINARAETAGTLRTWREAMARRRCLVPAAGFFEWGPAGGAKRKHLFGLPDSESILMAGLWGEFQDDRRLRFAILTTAANESMAPIHDRMPVIVREPEIGLWFSEGFRAVLDRRDVALARREA